LPFLGKKKEDYQKMSERYKSLRSSAEIIVNNSYDFNDKKTKIIYVDKLVNPKKFQSNKELKKIKNKVSNNIIV
jgi:hypothetical protein